MRYGVLSDIHGNYFALEAAIEALRREGVDGWICAGDVVGYGPQPNECVQAVAELEALCVAGNHELMLFGRLAEERCIGLAKDSIRWTREVLREDCCSYLAGLPTVATAPGLVVTHGSLDDPQEYVWRDSQASQQLDKLALQHPESDLLILGHTHRGWIYNPTRGTIFPPQGTASVAGGRFLLNPGSVGQSRQRERAPLVRCMLLDLDQQQVSLRSLPYDVSACRAMLRRYNLPNACIHMPPSALRAARSRARRLARRAADVLGGDNSDR
jgi:predicted phosphodiesterase